MASAPTKKEISLGIYENGLLNFGEFTYKSGIKGPLYMNLRNLGSHPAFLKQVSLVFEHMMKDAKFDLVGGIPYGAIPIMCSVSMGLNVPLVFPRKESKEYGMGKDLLGEYQEGQAVALVDDLVTKGDSKLESLVPLESAGLVIKDIFVLLDYDKGADELLQENGYTLHRFMTVREVIDILFKAGKVEDDMYAKVTEFLDSK